MTANKICSRWVKHYVSIIQKRILIGLRKRSKIWLRFFETRLWHREFTPMSPIVHSRRIYGYFKMRQIQQFQSNGRLFFRKHRTCHNRPTTTMQKSQFTTICLPVVTKKTNRRRRIALHHNASSYTSAQSTALLSTRNNYLMNHPPYSNDFFICTFIQISEYKQENRIRKFIS